MKNLICCLLVVLLTSCVDPADKPVTINRGSGIEATSSVTVAIVPLLYEENTTPGTKTQRALVIWLRANPRAKILHMDVVGNNGYPQEIVMLVEGKLGN